MFLAVALLLSLTASMPATVPDHTLPQVLDAIRTVETRGTPNSGRDSGGDSGRAIGPFQIHFAYWKDAGLSGKYEDCRDIEYARRVVQAYWKRYCPKALDECNAEVLARTHNGGPEGSKRDSTLTFWKKVRAELDKPPVEKPSKDAPTKAEKASNNDAPPPRSGA